MNIIKHYLIINSSPETVYIAISTQDGLSNWWTKETIAESKIGAIIEFKFSVKYHNKMRVTNLQPNKIVEWECVSGDDEWIDTKFKFSLELKDQRTVLRFEHSDWGMETDFFAHCNYNWGYYLRSLKLYCENGCGMPFADK